MNIAIFDELINSVSPVKARLAMKIDMVKPMPPRSPAPKICVHFRSEGSLEIPSKTAMKTNNVIPSGLPMTKPVNTPRLFELLSSSAQFEPMLIPVFALQNDDLMLSIPDKRLNLCVNWKIQRCYLGRKAAAN